MRKLFILLILLLLWIYKAEATHNRAGQIVYKHISGYTYEIEIWTYTYSKSQADRDTLTISWGDGTYANLPRVLKELLPGFYYENKYVGRHTYPGPGTFELVVEDPNRNEGVLNIPNSVNTLFALTTTLQINPFIGSNSAAILMTRPIDKAAVGRIFIHNPGAYDPDGDSLSFKMDTCRYNQGKKIPGFLLPPATNSIYVDYITGDFVWNTPPNVGIYNVAMKIEEWRNDIKISQIIRDIQIEVVRSNNRPPVLQTLEDICVVAGDTININVTATDPDNDGIFIERYGIPFEFDQSPATFPDSVYGIGSVSGTFNWNTTCWHIAKAPYVVTFKAADDNPEVSLTDYKKINITVVGPPVVLTEVSASNTNAIVKWTSNSCSNLVGYKIYRKNSLDSYLPEICTPGIPENWGYKLIATIEDPQQTNYIDQHLTPGFFYCYRIVPLYTDEKIEGIVSNNLCVEIVKGLPIITKASVVSTSTNNGENRVEWVEPISFDTLSYSRPFRFLLYFSPDLYGAHFQTPLIFKSIADSAYNHKNINTKNNPWAYKLELQHYDTTTNEFVSIGQASIASTPFLKIRSLNMSNELTIDENVPWQQEKYIIYRLNEQTSDFDSIGVSQINYFKDKGLVNGKQYCYKVKVISHYSADSLPDPIVNWSQIECGTPIDTIPPCCPVFEVVSDCENMQNVLKWKMPSDSCYESIAFYTIFYSSTKEGDLKQIAKLPALDTMFIHSPELSLAGCYTVGAIDSAGNSSNCTNNKICIDVCTYYQLPNVFTPNADNINDLYHPLPYKYVEKVDLKFYNRWGDIVFETQNPDINWKGTYMNSEKLLPEGVYYYIGDVYEYRLDGLRPRAVSGFVHLIRNQKNQKP